MSANFHLKLLSPDRSVIDGEASAVIIPGREGDFTALPLHMPLITSLREGEIEVHQPGSKPRIFKVSGGFADVGQHHCTVLAEDLTEETTKL